MGVSEGLFQGQDQAEADLHAAKGWTLGEQKPEFWDGFGALPAVSGIGQGAANGVAMLANSLRIQPQWGSSFDEFRASQTGEKPQEQPWAKQTNEVLDAIQEQARTGAKGLIPDPKTTGTAANMVNGFARSITEFGIGSLAGGPAAGAGVLGSTEAYARYHDLIDQGVDDATARKSALIAGITNAAGAVAPFSLPAKLLEPLSAAGTLLMQAGAGATINASMGAAARAGDAAILRKAGYPEMADQMQPWDEANLATDAITGAFFGAHAGLEGLKDSAVGPAVRDAAKVVQDRQEVINRAPGVPVDMASAAIHRQALESALGDLMTGKPVDLSAEHMDGATFARPDQDTQATRDIIREEFEKAGVLDDADDFDKWLRDELPKERAAPRETEGGQIGEMLTPEGVAARREDAQARLDEAGPEPKPEEREAMEEAERERLTQPESVRERLSETYGENMEKVVGEKAKANVSEAACDQVRELATQDMEGVEKDEEQLRRTADPAAAALQDRPALELPDTFGRERTRAALDEMVSRAQQRMAMEEQGRSILEDMHENGEHPRDVSEKFWKETYPKLGAQGQRLFQGQARALGFEPGMISHELADGTKVRLEDWPAVGKFLAEDMPEAEHLEGSQRGYVSSMKWANEQAAAHEQGAVKAADILHLVTEQAAQVDKEAETAFTAAVNCEARHQ